jgi:hypothetical protein
VALHAKDATAYGNLVTTQPGGEPRHLQAREKAMSDSDDFTAMNDPDFLAEYSRVRDTLETLTDRMRKLTEEFDRRARAQWASAS